MIKKPGAYGHGTHLKIVICAIAGIILLIGMYQGGRWLESRAQKPEERGDPSQRYVYDVTAQFDGVSYRQRRNLTTILMMGIDQCSVHGNSRTFCTKFLRSCGVNDSGLHNDRTHFGHQTSKSLVAGRDSVCR